MTIWCFTTDTVCTLRTLCVCVCTRTCRCLPTYIKHITYARARAHTHTHTHKSTASLTDVDHIYTFLSTINQCFACLANTGHFKSILILPTGARSPVVSASSYTSHHTRRHNIHTSLHIQFIHLRQFGAPQRHGILC